MNADLIFKSEDEKKRLEIEKNMPKRLRCLECKYCKKNIYRSSYSTNLIDSYTMCSFVPGYCVKFRQKLEHTNINLVCIVKDPYKAERYTGDAQIDSPGLPTKEDVLKDIERIQRYKYKKYKDGF